MRIDIMTLFPDTVGDVLSESILGRAQERGILRIDDECDLVAALQKYLFNFTAHLAVTDDCCLHLFRVYNICAQR